MVNAKDATAKVEAFTADAQKAATQQMEKLSRSFEDAATFGQDNMDAVMKSSNIAVKAAEELNNALMTYSRQSVEESVAAAKELSSVKTVPEFVEKQSAFVKSAFDGYMKNASKFSELFVNSAKEVFEPVNARATAAADLAKNFRA